MWLQMENCVPCHRNAYYFVSHSKRMSANSSQTECRNVFSISFWCLSCKKIVRWLMENRKRVLDQVERSHHNYGDLTLRGPWHTTEFHVKWKIDFTPWTFIIRHSVTPYSKSIFVSPPLPMVSLHRHLKISSCYRSWVPWKGTT